MRSTKDLQIRCQCKRCVHNQTPSKADPCETCTYTGHGPTGSGQTIGRKFKERRPGIYDPVEMMEMRIQELEQMVHRMAEIIMTTGVNINGRQ